MHALVAIRNNSMGTLSVTPADRRKVAQELTALPRAKVLGMLRQLTAASKSAQAAGVTAKAGSAGNAATAKSAETSGDSDSATRVAKSELDKDTFLQLLVTQMQHQDPLEPMDNSQMIAQLAQFTSLEQMNNLNDNFETLSGNIDQLNFINSTSLVGRTILGVDIEGNTVNGVVDRVHLDGSMVYLTVGEQMVAMAGVMGIE